MGVGGPVACTLVFNESLGGLAMGSAEVTITMVVMTARNDLSNMMGCSKGANIKQRKDLYEMGVYE